MKTSRITKKTLVCFLAIAIFLMSACNWLDGAVSSGIDKGFGNDKPCSGLVC